MADSLASHPLNGTMTATHASRRSALKALTLFPFALSAWPWAAGSAPLPAGRRPPAIRIGIPAPPLGNPPTFAGGGFSVVHAQGLLEEEFRADGVKIEWVFFKGAGPAVNEALTSRQLDFGLQGELPAMIARSAGVATRVVMGGGRGSNIYLAAPPQSPINAVPDLRGRRVAVPKGTTLQLAFDRILAAHGLTEKDVRIVSLDSATATAALQSRDVDAVVGAFDLLYAQSRGLAQVFYSTHKLPVATFHGQLVVTDDFALNYPDATYRVVRAGLKATRWAADEANRETLFKLFARIGIPEEIWRKEYEGVPLAERLSPLLDPYIVARYELALKESLRFGLLRREFDVNAWIDRSFLDRALKDLKLAGFWKPQDAAGHPLANAA
jgi:sulfonate transport system substrate-binding protein